VTGIRRDVPRAFDSDEYAQRRDQVNRELQAKREQFFEVLEKEAHERELAVNVTPMGILDRALIDGKAVDEREYDLPTEERKHEPRGARANSTPSLPRWRPSSAASTAARRNCWPSWTAS
jgi:hypothetical protein